MSGDKCGDGRGQPRRPPPVPPASIEAGQGTSLGRVPDRAETDLEATWAELEAIGMNTGHVPCRCPSCGGRAMISIVNSSGTSRWTKSAGGWPKCKQCRQAPRVEPLGDVSMVARVRPGRPMTEREWRRISKVRDAKRAAPEDGPT